MFKYLQPIETMKRVSREELAEKLDDLLEIVNKDNVGFVITNEGKDDLVLCPAKWFDFFQDDDFRCIVNSAVRYSLGRSSYMPSIQELSLGVLSLYETPLVGQHNILLNLLIIICIGYCVVKCFFSNIKRGGILLTQIAVGSLYLFSLPRGFTEGFTAWCKQIVALCFTTFMQTTLLMMGLVTMQSHPLLGLGVMLAANEVPRIAQHFGLDTSTRVNMMSAVHTTTTAINLTRAIAHK